MIIRQWYFPHSIIILETNAVLEFSALNRMIRWVVKREGLLFGYMVCSEYLQVNYPPLKNHSGKQCSVKIKRSYSNDKMSG